MTTAAPSMKARVTQLKLRRHRVAGLFFPEIIMRRLALQGTFDKRFGRSASERVGHAVRLGLGPAETREAALMSSVVRAHSGFPPYHGHREAVDLLRSGRLHLERTGEMDELIARTPSDTRSYAKDFPRCVDRPVEPYPDGTSADGRRDLCWPIPGYRKRGQRIPPADDTWPWQDFFPMLEDEEKMHRLASTGKRTSLTLSEFELWRLALRAAFDYEYDSGPRAILATTILGLSFPSAEEIALAIHVSKHVDRDDRLSTHASYDAAVKAHASVLLPRKADGALRDPYDERTVLPAAEGAPTARARILRERLMEDLVPVSTKPATRKDLLIRADPPTAQEMKTIMRQREDVS